MEFSEQVLVLQVGTFKESDVWVRFLSPSKGILSGFAFGGSYSKRRFAGCLDTFNRVLFRVKRTPRTQYLALQEGVLVKGVSRLRQDWARLGVATNCAKFLEAFGIGPEGAAKAHHLLEQTLLLLEEAESLPPYFPLLFRLRLAFDQGYALDLCSCGSCSAGIEGTAGYLAVREGLVFCSACKNRAQGQVVFLPEPSLALLRKVQEGAVPTWGETTLCGAARHSCSRAIDEFIHYHTGLFWENGRFVRS